MSSAVPTPSSQGGGARDEAPAFAKPPGRGAGRTGVRRPPPIEIPPPPSRLPVAPLEGQWSAEETASGINAEAAVDEHGAATAAQPVGIFHFATAEAMSANDYFGQRLRSFVSKRSSRRSFMSARSQVSDEGMGEGEGAPYENVDEDSSDTDDLQFFDAIDVDEREQDARMGGVNCDMEQPRVPVLHQQIASLFFMLFCCPGKYLALVIHVLVGCTIKAGQRLKTLQPNYNIRRSCSVQTILVPLFRVSHVAVSPATTYPIEQEHMYPSPGVPSMPTWGEPSTPGKGYFGPATARAMKPEFLTRIPRAWAMDDDEDDCVAEEKVEVFKNISITSLDEKLTCPKFAIVGL